MFELSPSRNDDRVDRLISNNQKQIELNNILKTIIDFKDYNTELDNKSIGRSSYELDLRAGSKQLYYYGAEHTFELGSAVLEGIDAYFSERQPDLVIIEGQWSDEMMEQALGCDLNQLVKKFGEAGYALRQAYDRGIDMYCPEPNARQVFDNLTDKGYSREQIFAWQLSYAARHYSKQERPGVSFERFAQRYVDYLKSGTDWPDFDFSPIRAIKLIEQFAGLSIDLKTFHRDYPDFNSPIAHKQTIFNVMDADWDRLRDRKIVTDIAKALQVYNNIFVVYGMTHAILQEPALRQLMRSSLVTN